MKVINLEQNSTDWLTWREGGIGASDCPIILHESPFKSAHQLWMEKTGRCPKPAPTRATTHGQVSEDTARIQLSHELEMELLPVSVMDDEAPYLRASYDGYNLRDGVITEIKCPMTPKDHRRAKEGDIPWYYRLQMYQQMHIARASSMIYYSWFKGEGILLPIKLDEEFWFGTALPTIQEFWRRVQENEWPQPNGQNVYADDKELVQAAGDWFQSRKLIETGEYTQRIAEAVFKRAAGEARNFISGGIQCQQQVWRPKYLVEIECESPTVQEAVLRACLSLEERINAKVKIKTFEPKVVHKFTEIPE
jgi:putative phage-type endonuclease